MPALYSDERLVSKALGGSQRSWVKLVARHETRIYNHCLRLCGNSHDAMDLMQEVFLSVYRNLPSFRGQSAFTTWMMRIASNKSIDYLRANRRSRQQSLDEMAEAGELQFSMPEHGNPDAEYEQHATSRELSRLMAQLSPDQKVVVELKYFQQFTFEEIGFQLGVPANTVKTRLYTALQSMKGRAEVQHVM